MVKDWEYPERTATQVHNQNKLARIDQKILKFKGGC